VEVSRKFCSRKNEEPLLLSGGGICIKPTVVCSTGKGMKALKSDDNLNFWRAGERTSKSVIQDALPQRRERGKGLLKNPN